MDRLDGGCWCSERVRGNAALGHGRTRRNGGHGREFSRLGRSTTRTGIGGGSRWSWLTIKPRVRSSPNPPVPAPMSGIAREVMPASAATRDGVESGIADRLLGCPPEGVDAGDVDDPAEGQASGSRQHRLAKLKDAVAANFSERCVAAAFLDGSAYPLRQQQPPRDEVAVPWVDSAIHRLFEQISFNKLDVVVIVHGSAFCLLRALRPSVTKRSAARTTYRSNEKPLRREPLVRRSVRSGRASRPGA